MNLLYPQGVSLGMILLGIVMILVMKNLFRKLFGVSLLQGGIVLLWTVIAHQNSLLPSPSLGGLATLVTSHSAESVLVGVIFMGMLLQVVLLILVVKIYRATGLIHENALKEFRE